MLAVSTKSGATDDEGDGSAQASAFKVGDEAWICDSGASTHMTPSADCMLNYREYNLKLRIADGSTRSMESRGSTEKAPWMPAAMAAAPKLPKAVPPR